MILARHDNPGDGLIGGGAWSRFRQATLVPLSLGLLTIAACAMDQEAAVRAQLNNWVVLEETQYFKSGRDCTAGLFAIGAKQTLSGLTRVRSTSQGMRQIGQGRAVAFELNGKTPAQVQEDIDRSDHSVGLAMLASGLAAKPCFTPALQSAFAQTLNTVGTVLIYDPDNHALALLDGVREQVFYTRGEL